MKNNPSFRALALSVMLMLASSVVPPLAAQTDPTDSTAAAERMVQKRSTTTPEDPPMAFNRFGLGAMVTSALLRGEFDLQPGVGGGIYFEYAQGSPRFPSRLVTPIMLTFTPHSTPAGTAFFLGTSERNYSSDEWLHIGLDAALRYLFNDRSLGQFNPFVQMVVGANTFIGRRALTNVSSGSLSSVSFGGGFGAENLISDEVGFQLSTDVRLLMITGGSIGGERGRFEDSPFSLYVGLNAALFLRL
jgi:hypothetical protein